MNKENGYVQHRSLFAYGYGLGEFGFTFFNFFIAYYLMFYLTDVLEIPMGITAILYTAIQWVEAILMFLAGIIIDRSHLRGGKYRPWIMIGSVLTMITTILCFSDFHIGTAAAVIVFIVLYTLIYLGYNVMWVAFRTLLDPLSTTATDVVRFSNASSQMGSVAGIIFSLTGSKLLYAWKPDMERGYLVSAVVYTIVMVVCMMIVSSLVKPFDGSQQKKVEEKVTVRELLRGINRQFIVLLLALTFRESASTLLPSMLAYFFQYVIGDSGWMTTYMMVITLTTLMGYSFSPALVIRFGKKKMFIATSLIACVALMIVRGAGTVKLIFMTCMAVYMFCGIFSGAMIPVFMNDLATYNEANFGIRGHAFNSSVGGCALRLSQVVGGGVASLGLFLIGYHPGVEVDAPMKNGIMNLMTGGCIIVIVISIIIFSLYKLEGEKLDEAYTKEQNIRGNE